VFGWRRRRVLMLGSGPLAVLAPQELVALIAHELGHARNGDARRGLVVGSAVSGLAELHALMVPPDVWVAPLGSEVNAAAPFAELLQRIAALIQKRSHAVPPAHR
jgi:Zn-dependent protease with chaperone function